MSIIGMKDEDGKVYDRCRCRAKAVYVIDTMEQKCMVECSLCRLGTGWHKGRSGAMVEWNLARRKEREV